MHRRGLQARNATLSDRGQQEASLHIANCCPSAMRPIKSARRRPRYSAYVAMHPMTIRNVSGTQETLKPRIIGLKDVISRPSVVPKARQSFWSAYLCYTTLSPRTVRCLAAVTSHTSTLSPLCGYFALFVR